MSKRVYCDMCGKHVGYYVICTFNESDNRSLRHNYSYDLCYDCESKLITLIRDTHWEVCGKPKKERLLSEYTKILQSEDTSEELQ